MSVRVFRIALLVAVLGVAVFFLSNEEYQKPIRQTLKDAQRTDTWKSTKKTWDKSYKKLQAFVGKIQEGKLSEDIATYIDKICQGNFGVGLGELQTYLQKIDAGRAGLILSVVWVAVGYVLYKFTSTGSTLFIMAAMLLLHAFYGKAWCLYQALVFTGLLMYFVSLVANNAVLSAMVVCIVYSFSTLFYFVGGHEGDALYRLEESIHNVNYRVNIVDNRVSKVDKKLDKLLKKRQTRSSSGDD